MNRNYAKRIAGAFQYAPSPLQTGSGDCFTNDAARYLAAGYKRLERTAMPVRAGYHYTSEPGDWLESEAAYTQAWSEHENPPAEDLGEIIDILTGEAT